MSEPKRWMDEGPPEAVERLLQAASAERPPEASLSRTLTALGLGAGATSAATTAGATTAGATTAGASAVGTAGSVSAGKATTVLAGSALVKWGLVGGALVAASVGGTVAVKRASLWGGVGHGQNAMLTHGERTTPNAARTTPDAARTTPDAAATAPNVERTKPSIADAPSVAETTPDSAKDAPSAPVVGPNSAASPASETSPTGVSNATPQQKNTNSASPVPAKPARRSLARAESASAPAPSEASAPIDAERLAEEVALVDRARGALARGDAAGTIAALDDYDARFSRRKFAPEELYLRMEALLRLGQTSAARSVAERLATTYPSSPNAARARQVVGASIP